MISFVNGEFEVTVHILNKRIYIGTYTSREEASKAERVAIENEAKYINQSQFCRLVEDMMKVKKIFKEKKIDEDSNKILLDKRFYVPIIISFNEELFHFGYFSRNEVDKVLLQIKKNIGILNNNDICLLLSKKYPSLSKEKKIRVKYKSIHISYFDDIDFERWSKFKKDDNPIKAKNDFLKTFNVVFLNKQLKQVSDDVIIEKIKELETKANSLITVINSLKAML